MLSNIEISTEDEAYLTREKRIEEAEEANRSDIEALEEKNY